MQLGRKLAEGFAVDSEADALEQPDVENASEPRPTVQVVTAIEHVELPARV
ncbi:MAG: hypothetical protein QOG20_4785 [Pseudonocardiales bacterium]|jgi:hypothetical protein|nr:hypothetical protein [Pseudonocardiales bacterium]MDT7709178.1 hypothetical protein [Pseudonocardiales bacterium]